MGRPLTARQQQVYDFIHSKISTRGYGPTVREIGEFLGIRSPNGVMCHLRALERKGMILRVANKSRAIELTNRKLADASPGLTVVGEIRSNVCHFYDLPLSCDVLVLLDHPERYLVKFHGYDLLEWAIADGDILVVQNATTSPPNTLHLVRLPTGQIELANNVDTSVAGIISRRDGGSETIPMLGNSSPERIAPTVHEDREAETLDAPTTTSPAVIGVVVGIVRTHLVNSHPTVHRPHLHSLRMLAGG